MSLIEAVEPSNLEVIARIAGATALGAVIGTERELDGHDAGTRTHALLALGAGLFGVISVGAFGDFIVQRADTNVQVDVTRIASYVAAGVGFLGGGAILKQSNRVRGLTTAASLWTAAAVGLAAGLGFWIGAVAATIATVVILLLDAPLRRLRRRGEKRSLLFTFSADVDAHDVLARCALGPNDVARVSLTRTDRGHQVTIDGLDAPVAERMLREIGGDDDVIESTLF